MTFKLATLATLGLAALAVTAPASAEQSKGDEQLAKLLEGRVAGEPTRCVPSHVNARIYMIDKTALVYDAGARSTSTTPPTPKRSTATTCW